MTLSLRSRVGAEKWAFARMLRKRMTPSEKTLWALIRKRQLGVKFRRQVIIRGWIVDFYCPELRLVVEVDGGYHDAAKDAYRDGAMEQLGLTVLRFTNGDVDTRPTTVVRTLTKHINRASVAQREA